MGRWRERDFGWRRELERDKQKLWGEMGECGGMWGCEFCKEKVYGDGRVGEDLEGC